MNPGNEKNQLNEKNSANQTNQEYPVQSILNYVLGPVMRGPSSSHTAASYFIGKLVGDLANYQIKQMKVIFNTGSSWAQVYRMQNSELGFIAGALNFDWAHEQFFQMKTIAEKRGIVCEFAKQSVEGANHPNYIQIEIQTQNDSRFVIHAKSMGGGSVQIVQINGWSTQISGEYFYTLCEYQRDKQEQIQEILSPFQIPKYKPIFLKNGDLGFYQVTSLEPLSPSIRQKLEEMSITYYSLSPVFQVIKGDAPFRSSQDILDQIPPYSGSLGDLGLEYEAQVLQKSKSQIMLEVQTRLEVMLDAVLRGLEAKNSHMRILAHSASSIQKKSQRNSLFTNNLNTKVAIYTLAAMDVASSGGMICAAPTGGSAGVIPGILYVLKEECHLSTEQLCKALLAAGVIGVINSYRSTFAAEVAGCQVEIGMAGAMGAAAVMEAAMGSPAEALNAASISLQNTMGSVCDLIGGLCEIPCHTRNATVAASAFVNVDLILGGYINPIPLDEALDASLASGKMLPEELRCTSLGGIAVSKTALFLSKLIDGEE